MNFQKSFINGLVAALSLGLVLTVTIANPDMVALLLIVLVIIAILVALSLLVARAAERKGRSFWTFFWLSAIFSPVVFGIAVALMRDSRSPDSSATKHVDEPPIGSTSSFQTLKELHEQGLISEEEYQAKKAQLLDRI